MYKDDYVAVLQDQNGVGLWEDRGRVFIKNESEYSILLKNLNCHRCVAKITIDGKDVLNGHKLVIDKNSNVILSRFLIDGNLDRGPRFKVISKESTECQDPSNPEIGKIKIEFYKERIKNNPFEYRYKNIINDTGLKLDPIFGNFTHTTRTDCTNWTFFQNDTVTKNRISFFSPDGKDQIEPEIKKAATSMGSISNQSFIEIEDFETNPDPITFEINLYIKEETLTIKDKKYCSMCGKKLKLKDNYCYNCGEKCSN